MWIQKQRYIQVVGVGMSCLSHYSWWPTCRICMFCLCSELCWITAPGFQVESTSIGLLPWFQGRTPIPNLSPWNPPGHWAPHAGAPAGKGEVIVPDYFEEIGLLLLMGNEELVWHWHDAPESAWLFPHQVRTVNVVRANLDNPGQSPHFKTLHHFWKDPFSK